MYYECKLCGNIYDLNEPIFVRDYKECETFTICPSCHEECVLVNEEEEEQ